uniref:Os01g0778700 protein n=1 Tax=Macrostomum lignano TaxID=282301 RepID=A0A1I8F5Y4_9PLAT
ASSFVEELKGLGLRGGRLSTRNRSGSGADRAELPVHPGHQRAACTTVVTTPSKNFNVVWPCRTAEHPAGRLPAAATTAGRLAAFTTPDWGRHRATMLRRLRGVRQRVRRVKVRLLPGCPGRCYAIETSRTLPGFGEGRIEVGHFTESTGETAAAATPAEQLQQQQAPISSGGTTFGLVGRSDERPGARCWRRFCNNNSSSSSK